MANSVRINAPATGYRSGTYNIEVYIQSTDDLDGIQISFAYATAIWNDPDLNTAVTNNAGGSWSYIAGTNPGGKVRFSLANLGTPQTFSTETKVATVSMQVKSDAAAGSTNLTWDPTTGQGTGLQTIITSSGSPVAISTYTPDAMTVSIAADTEVPTAVSTITVDSILVHIAYSGATDNISVDHYEIFDTLYAVTDVTGLIPAVSTTGESADVEITSDLTSDHYITVVAVDGADNKSTIKSVTLNLAPSREYPQFRSTSARRIESVSVGGVYSQIKLYLYS